MPRLAPTALDRLGTHPWPGNVRELEHAIESAVVLTSTAELHGDDLELAAPEAGPERPGSKPTSRGALPDGLTLAELEGRYVEQTVERAGGNRTRAAALLGIGRNTLLRKLRGRRGVG